MNTAAQYEAPRAGHRPAVRSLTLDASGVPLSALLSEPDDGTEPRATVVAVHGGGMTAGYFDARARPGLSLLTLGAQLGYSVLAVDRPGYGRSARKLPDGETVAGQTGLLRSALADFADRHPTGAGLFLLAHSFGGKLALSTAAAEPERAPGDPLRLIGLDISGCGHRYAAVPQGPMHGRQNTRRHWGPLGLYPPGTFSGSADVVAPMPRHEEAELPEWPRRFETLAPLVRVPVRFTFAEHESWWLHSDADLADLAARLTAAPRVVLDRLPGAGHNISLGWAARTYHLRALAFLEECLQPG